MKAMNLKYSHKPHRRLYERLNVDFQAVIMNADNVRQDVVLRNISTRGVCVESVQPFRLGTLMDLWIGEPPFLTSSLQKKAKVVWWRPLGNNRYCAGLDFGLDNMIELVKRPVALSPVSVLSAVKKFIRWFFI
jgi:hypothetical protein